MQQPFNIYPLGDSAATFQLGNTINEVNHQQLLNMQQWLVQQQFNFIRNIITAYNSITIIYDVCKVKLLSLHTTTYTFICHLLQQAYLDSTSPYITETTTVQIPVCYNPEYALDIDLVAQHNNISIEEVIALHCSTKWRVYMIGFLPGFPYMGILPQQLVTPRRKTPRMQVEAGSVGIAGHQTGIYSMASPGGWNIIGKTPLTLFDAGKEKQCLLQAGDWVNFYPISKSDLKKNYKI